MRIQPINTIALGNADLEPSFNASKHDPRLTLEQVIDNVKHTTGIVTAHLAPLQRLAIEYKCVIGIRPVEEAAKGLIEDGHPTKGFHIKGKSSDWGPQAGTICINQALSKLEGFIKTDPTRIEKFNSQTNECVTNGHAVAVPLTITRDRLEVLLEANVISHVQPENEAGSLTLQAQGPSGEMYTFQAKREPDFNKETYVISLDGKPLEVLANEEGGKVLTADYDLYMIAPSIADFGAHDNLPVPDVAHSLFKARIDGYSDQTILHLPPALRDDYKSAKSFYRKEDPHIGNATSRIREMIPVINQALVNKGEPVVHHNADSGSPAANKDANYPATFFLPSAVGRFDVIVVIENSQDMAGLIQEVKDAGYHVPLNPLWEQELTSVRRTSFTNSRDLLEVFMSAPERRSSTPEGQ